MPSPPLKPTFPLPIKTHISITLEIENGQYATCAELFKIHCRSHRVIDHIIKPTPPTVTNPENATTRPINPPQSEEAKELWNTLDATVLQWSYATVSTDLLHTILEPDSTTMAAWNRLRDIFQDNKHSRAITLQQDFSHNNMANFPNASVANASRNYPINLKMWDFLFLITVLFYNWL